MYKLHHVSYMKLSRVSKCFKSSSKRLVTKSKDGPVKPQKRIWDFGWNHEICFDCLNFPLWIVELFELCRLKIMELGFSLILQGFWPRLLQAQSIYFSQFYQHNVNTIYIYICCIMYFLFAIPACEHFWVGSGWSLSIYLVFQLVCKSNLGGTVWWRVFVLAPVGNSTDLIVITLFAQQLFCTTFNGFYLRF